MPPTGARLKTVEDRVNKPGAYNPYTQEQRELLARIVKGDTGQNVCAVPDGRLTVR